jgi:hypothetical protein
LVHFVALCCTFCNRFLKLYLVSTPAFTGTHGADLFVLATFLGSVAPPKNREMALLVQADEKEEADQARPRHRHPITGKRRKAECAGSKIKKSSKDLHPSNPQGPSHKEVQIVRGALGG